jgi:putative copper export protein/mono/diheme cytochrome c family protein
MNELSAVVRFVHLSAAVLLVGRFAFVLLIARPALEKARIGADDRNVSGRRLHRQIVIWSLFALSVSALLGLCIQIVNVGDPAPRTFFERLAAASLLTDTQYGKVWLFRMVLLMGLSAMLFHAAKNHLKDDSSILLAGGLGLSACLLASISLSGHAATADGAALAMQISADALHLLAGGVWLGGLVPLFAFLRRCNQTTHLGASVAAQEATRRYSRLGLVCVAVLIATGSYNAWILVGGLPPLFGTTYGRLLLIKLGLLLPLLGVAATNLLRLKPKIISASPDGPEPKSALVEKLTRNVLIEACVGAMILYIVGHMAVTPPARHVQPEWPFSFRWDWSALNKAPKLRAEVERGMFWAAVGGVAIVSAALRRRRRAVSITIALGALGYAGDIIHAAVSIDAYPATYKRPAVAYQAISVANGKFLYEEAGCVACHGAAGYGDGPAAEGFNPKPADLTAPHANTHTAGDLFWWLSYGVKQSSGMPGFGQSLSEEERWDLINYMRALSSGERARNLAPVIDENPWLVAPDFAYGTNAGDSKTLKDHRGDRIVLLVALNLQDTEERLRQLGGARQQLQSAGVEIIVVPNPIDQLFVADKLPGLIMTEGIREISDSYSLFARSFADQNPLTGTPHVEYLIDKQGYIRARWLPAENDAWRKIDLLLKQVELLRNEKPRAPAPDDHVH